MKNIVNPAITTALVAAAMLITALPSPASAQTPADGPIRIVVPYGPGSAVDTVPRMVAERLSAELGQPVIVQNKTGGMGLPAIQDILNAPADGRSVLVADAALWAVNPALRPVTYDFVRDFAPLSLNYNAPLIAFTSTASEINSLQELVAKAKVKPGQLNYATMLGTSLHLAVESMKTSLSIDMKPIGYRAAGEMVESVIRGDTQMGLSTLNAVMPHVKAGRLKMLAVTVPVRLNQIPDVPTVAEATGLKDFNFPVQTGFFVKAGTPRPVIERLAAAIRKVQQQPDLAAKVVELTAAELTPSSPEQLGAVIKGDILKIEKVVKAAGIKAP